MPDPIEYQNEYRETTAGTPPPPPGYPPAPGQPAPSTSGQRVPAVGGQRVVTQRGVAAPPGYRARQLIWIAIAIVDLILVLDFIFFLAGANDVGFGRIVYVVGGALNAPFRGLFNVTLTKSGHPVQWADALAVGIYTIAAFILERVVAITSTPSPRREGPPPPV